MPTDYMSVSVMEKRRSFQLPTIFAPMMAPSSMSVTGGQRDVIVVRYADNSIVGFESPEDAHAFLGSLPKRLGQFGPTLNEVKTPDRSSLQRAAGAGSLHSPRSRPPWERSSSQDDVVIIQT
jgi:hypothetical protein